MLPYLFFILLQFYVTISILDNVPFVSSGPHSTVGSMSHTVLEIDHEIISTAILLPSGDSRRVVVSTSESMCTK